MEQFLKPLHLACIADVTRPNYRLIEIKNDIAQAANGHMIIKINLKETSLLTEDQIHTMNGEYIDMEVWKEIHKCDQIEVCEDSISCWKNGIKKTFEYSKPNGEFFHLDDIILTVKVNGEEEKRMMCYNPKFIETIAKVFQEPKLYFSFSKGNQGTIVFPNENSGMFALLMPMDASGTNRYMFMTT